MSAASRSTAGAVPRVLSVQSHVVHGYVGNRAAVFPLQLLGFEVDVVNSVQFSCHTGYPAIRGQKLGGEDLHTLVDGLVTNEVLDHTHLLTGYIGTVTFLEEVAQLLDRLPKSCQYVCDPVLGDNGRLYTSPDLVGVYRSLLLPRVAVLTPNQFEAELLTERTIHSLADAASVCDALHALGPPTVVLTTLDMPDATNDGAMVAMMLSEVGGSKWLLQLPRIEGGPFTGTGDLSAAMILAWRHFHPLEAPLALEKVGAVLQGVIGATVAQDKGREIGGKLVPPEIKIIGCKRIIEDPEVRWHCRLMGTPASEPRGVVFDMDGTLTQPGQLDLVRLRERVGVPADQAIVPFLKEKYKGDDEGLSKVMAIVEEEEVRAFSPPQLREGLKECVELLVARGVRVGIFTRNCQACVTALVRHAQLPEDAFSPVITRDSPIPGKPDAAPVLHCCEAWGLEVGSVLVVGDQIDDVLSGKSAGCRTVAILAPQTRCCWGAAADMDATTERLHATADLTVSSLVALRRFFPG